MFKPLLALLATAGLGAAAPAQAPSTGRWVLEVAPTGCIVHTASASGTVVSILGIAGQDSLSFVIQNKEWNSLPDGERYDVQISFDGSQAFPMKAMARQNIDRDGPGITFAVSPSEASGGATFLERFAAADGMHIARDGRRLETVALADSQVALQGLARCLSQIWAGASEGEGSVELAADATAI